MEADQIKRFRELLNAIERRTLRVSELDELVSLGREVSAFAADTIDQCELRRIARMTEAEVDAELRALGCDPADIGRRGAEFLRKLRAELAQA